MEELSERRRRGLMRNGKLLFWSEAFTHVFIMTAIMQLFLQHRGVSVGWILALAVMWAVTSLVTEIPSSYMADRWGRKKTLIVGRLVFLVGMVGIFFAHGVWQFMFVYACYGFAFAARSGTMEALLYDSACELGQEGKTLQKLASLKAAEKVFRIITPGLGALIAHYFTLSETLYRSFVAFDLLCAFIGIACLFYLTEPKLSHDNGIAGSYLSDFMSMATEAIRVLIKQGMIPYILNRTILFIAGFMLWRYYQIFFVEGYMASVFELGIMWSLCQAGGFVGKMNISRFVRPGSESRYINLLNIAFAIFLCMFLIAIYFSLHRYWLMTLFCFIMISENLRWPLFSEIINKHSESYNRATVLSMAGLIKSIADIMLLPIAALLVTVNMVYVYIWALFVALVVIFYLRLGALESNKA